MLMVLAAALPIAIVPVVAAPPTVIPVAVVVPILNAPEIESTKGVVTLVLARAVPVIRESPVWSAAFWF